MPNLIPVSFMERTNSPFVWYCSGCQAVFSLERMAENPSITELQRVNANFQTHCKAEHPNEKAAGLVFALPKEDSSQSANRIVREATEGK